MTNASQFGARVWKSKNGHEQTWDKMATSHLRNTANWIERQSPDDLKIDPRLDGLSADDLSNLVGDMRAYALWREEQEAINAPA